MAADQITYMTAALAGLISFLSPCVLPLVPAYLSYMAGATVDEITTAEGDEARAMNRKVMRSAISFVLGFSVVFIALGAGASVIGRTLLMHQDVIGKIAGVLIIIFGLHFMGVFKIAFLNREVRFNPDLKEGMGLLGPFLIGLAFAFGWTPCIGPILGTILTIAGSKDSLGYGVSLLTVYSLGLGIPFLLAAMGIGRFMGFMKRARRHMHAVEVVAGLLLVVTGVAMFTGMLQTLGNDILNWAPWLESIVNVT